MHRGTWPKLLPLCAVTQVFRIEVALHTANDMNIVKLRKINDLCATKYSD